MAVAGLVALVVAVRIGSDDGNDGEDNNGDLYRKDLNFSYAFLNLKKIFDSNLKVNFTFIVESSCRTKTE